MRLTIELWSNETGRVEVKSTCRMGEYNGDGRFDQPLVGEETLTEVLQAWRAQSPLTRNFTIVGPDEHRTLIIVIVKRYGDSKGPRITEIAADDTTWLFPLDRVLATLPAPQPRWSIDLVSAAPPVPAERTANLDLYNDPDFWIDEHSDRL
jgi:hypothetical protein